MSRRSIIVLAAAVVMLYFSIILFMLSPLHGAKSAYYGNSYMNHFGFRQVPSVNWCKELKWRSPPSPNVVALVSFPGSGNTWLRYLLQQATDFNRLHKGHIGTAPKSAFKRKSQEHKKSDWVHYVSAQLPVWESLHRLWLTRFVGPVHIVFYEVLVRDTRHTIRGILDFLNATVSEESMNCALANKEGIYRRKKKQDDFDPFTSDMYIALDEVRNRVLHIVADYRKRNNITDRSEGYF